MSARLDTYRRLIDVEPHLQAGRGMMRNGELSLVARVCREHMISAYVEFGCGMCFSLEEVRGVCGHKIALYGFDQVPVPPCITKPIGAVVYKMGIHSHPLGELNEETLEICRILRATTFGSFLWLTDNGYKIGELKSIVDVAQRGDLIATHDYTTEVTDASIPFLCTNDYRILDQVEKECEDHGYLLRFWEKL